MLTYNSSYPYQYDTSQTCHYSYGTANRGNTIVLNLSTPNSCNDCGGNSNICDTSDDLNKIKDDLSKCKDELNKIKNELSKCESDSNKDKEDLERCKNDLSKCKNDKDKDDEDKDGIKDDIDVITSQEITSDHAEVEKCGDFAGAYEVEEMIGCKGFYTYDLINLWHPKMYNNTDIMEHITDGTYGAVNYVFAFTSNLRHTKAVLSNMLCKECESQAEHFACQKDEFKSFCSTTGGTYDSEESRHLLTKVCPNLVSESKEMPNDIKAKQIAPLILVNESGEMIGKDGSNTAVKYEDLEPYLVNGRIKNCADDLECEKYKGIMEEVAWDTDKVILLKASDNVRKTSIYSHDIEEQDIYVFTDIVI